MKKAFTIIELLVAMTVIVIILAGSGYVFHTAVKAEKSARATAEIARKLRGITDQLNADFEGLKKDGEIFIVWIPGIDTDGDNFVDRFERSDRLMFFTSGDFYSYNEQTTISGDKKPIRGNIARITYMLARNSKGQKAYQQKPFERVLARTQHLLTSDPELPDLPFGNPYTYSDTVFLNHNLNNEYDKSYGTYKGWLNINNTDKQRILSMLLDIRVGLLSNLPPNEDQWGTLADKNDPQSVHKLFCEGVGEFSVQGWYLDEDAAGYRWFPMLDPNMDGVYSDSDFLTSGTDIIADSPPVVWYPEKYHRMGPDVSELDPSLLTEENFNNIPGLGRALKFTFTLYDSYGVFPEGKTFSHIIYLD